MKVAIVVRVEPAARAADRFPSSSVSAVAVGQPVTFEVDAYPGRQFEGKVKYVSPSLQADQRALTVEALVPNPERRAEAGTVRHRAHRAADAYARRAGAGAPSVTVAPARAACSSSTAITSKNASSRPDRPSAI